MIYVSSISISAPAQDDKANRYGQQLLDSIELF